MCMKVCAVAIAAIASVCSYADQPTLDTPLGDVLGSTPLSEMQTIIAPFYNDTRQTVEDLANMEHLTTNVVQQIVTNLTFAGWTEPYSAWTNNWQSHLDLQPTQPVYNYSLGGWVFSMTNKLDGTTNSTQVIMNTPTFAVEMATEFSGGTIKFGRTGTPLYRNTLGIAMKDELNDFVTKEDVCGAVTNVYTIGYTDWEFSGAGVVPGVNYSISFAGAFLQGSDVQYRWNLLGNGTYLTYYQETNANPLSLSFVVNGQINATRRAITRNALGLARMEDLTNYVTHAELDAMDTSYFRMEGITNKNQSIQYVVNNSVTPWNLDIVIPSDGETKDWIVYVYSQTNATVRLPTDNNTITWWAPKDSVVNDIKPSTPTAFYFSQVAYKKFTINRQELTALALAETNKVPENVSQ